MHKFNPKLSTFIMLFCIVIASIADYFCNYVVPDEFISLSNVFLDMIVGIIGVMSALYFVYIQIYVNRYPSKLLGKIFGIPIKNSLIMISLLLIYGISLILYPSRYFSHILFWALAIFYLFIFFIVVIISMQKMSINACVVDYICKMEKSLKGEPRAKEFKKILDDLYSIYEECITKEEYYICQSISKSTTDIFKSLLKEHNKLLLEKSLKEDEAIELSMVLLEHSFRQIVCTKDINSPQFVYTVTRTPIEYIVTCIKIGQYNLFKKCVDEFARFVYCCLNDNNSIIAKKLYYGVNEIIDELVDKNDSKEWLLYLLQRLSTSNVACCYNKSDSCGELFVGRIFYALEKCIDVSDGSYYDEVFTVFKKHILDIARIEQNMEHIRIYFIKLIDLLVERKDIRRIDLFDSFFSDVQRYVIENENWVELIFYYISSLTTCLPDTYEEKMREKNILVLLDVLSLDKNSFKTIRILLPDYEKDVEMNKENLEKIKGYVKEIEKLCNKAIVKNNTDIYYIFLELLNRCLMVLPKNAKNVQMELFSVYYTNLYLVSSVNNKLFSEMTISMLRFSISELDRNKKLSKDFVLELIKEMSAVSTRANNVSDFLTDEIIETFYIWNCDDEDEICVLSKESDIRKELFKAIYSIGIYCVEYGKEESLRKVSNTMGWSFINLLKGKNSNETIKYLFHLISSLYKIAVDLQVSKKTLTFLMTLFTTVGTYCELNPNHYCHQNDIIKFISKYGIDAINTAAQIRTKDDSSWDEVFGGNASDYTNKFLKKVKKYIDEQAR